ncbi:MAG: hypothetical protein JW730_20170 [Anaerolineales bacterium]|nr:hypothetical protein [Anaerolineales bacterium]
MPTIMESILNIVLVIGFQIAVYAVFLRSKIMTWGASKEEAAMPLIGDDLAPNISSTRAITIHAPASEVWKWIIQLGADRGGFFSYSFLEKALGYEMRDEDPVPEFQEMQVGRIVPASIDESKSLIKYNFRVVAVEPGKSFVLENWGAFVLKEIDSKRIRLLVRTHGQPLPDLKSKIEDFLFMPLHYIMERRMLMGMKAQAEGIRLSAASDNLWLLGVLLSGIGIALMIFLGQGLQNTFLSVIYGIAWLWVFLIFEPKPTYSLTLLLLEVLTIIMNAALIGK